MAKETKISLEQVKQISPKTLLSLINKAKTFLKKDKVMLEALREYEVSPDEIDVIPVMFKELEVSARTEQGVIYLNYKLLCDGDFFKDYGYLVHEVVHYFQQTRSDGPTKSSKQYLENPDEQEGFAHQIAWLDHHFGEDEAKDYTENLLDYHDKSSDKEVKDALLSKI